MIQVPDPPLDYHDLFAGRSVCLIGGAPKYHKGRAATADLVVRVGAHFLRQGGRVDVLYNHGGVDTPLLIKDPRLRAARYIWANRTQALNSLLKKYSRENKIPYKTFFRPDFRLGPSHQPFTGVLALMHLSRLYFRDLFVTGMDLYYRPEADPPFPDPASTGHDFKSQVLILEELKKDRRITYDRPLLEALEAAKVLFQL